MRDSFERLNMVGAAFECSIPCHIFGDADRCKSWGADKLECSVFVFIYANAKQDVSVQIELVLLWYDVNDHIEV